MTDTQRYAAFTRWEPVPDDFAPTAPNGPTPPWALEGVRREPLTYERHSPHSFFRDVGRASVYRDEEALRRLDRHAVETRTNPGSNPTFGGEFTPPVYLVDDFQTAAKVGRHFADLLGPRPIPRTSQTIYIPRWVGTNVLGQDTGTQGGDGGPIMEQDDATANNSSPVVTIAGQMVVTQQFLDQAGGPGADVIVYTELRKDYNAVMNGQLITGTGAAGFLTGLINYTIPTANTVDGSSVPATSPTMLTALWVLMGKAFAAVGNNRGHRPEIWLMSPRRWASIAFSLDTATRPIAEPEMLSMGTDQLTTGPGPDAIGSAGGIPVFTDGSLLTGGAAGTENIYCLRIGDMYLFESPEMIQTSVNATAGTLQVRLMLHHYVAFVGNLFSSSIGVVKNIPTPTGF